MNLDLKYCKKCKKAFDIGINFEECHDCRDRNKNEEKGDGRRT